MQSPRWPPRPATVPVDVVHQHLQGFRTLSGSVGPQIGKPSAAMAEKTSGSSGPEQLLDAAMASRASVEPPTAADVRGAELIGHLRRDRARVGKLLRDQRGDPALGRTQPVGAKEPSSVRTSFTESLGDIEDITRVW